LPIQLCALLQQTLDVPVQLIQWGHPNTRESKCGSHWAREHQVKIFAEAFESVVFTIEYKNKTLQKFARQDRKLHGALHKCNPNPEIRRVQKKKRHPDEKSSALPARLRNHHYNAYWQICRALGCEQYVSGTMPLPLESEVDEEAEIENTATSE